MGNRNDDEDVEDDKFGWGTRIRTYIHGVRVRGPAVRRSPSIALSLSKLTDFRQVSQGEMCHTEKTQRNIRSPSPNPLPRGERRKKNWVSVSSIISGFPLKRPRE